MEQVRSRAHQAGADLAPNPSISMTVLILTGRSTTAGGVGVR
jgi:hypothetical protein